MQPIMPPPSRPPGASYMRARRSAAPFSVPQQDVLDALSTAAAGKDASRVKDRTSESSSGFRRGSDGRQGPLHQLQSQQPTRHDDQHETATLVASLQLNVQGLTASNQREKAMSEHMKKQIQALTNEITKMKDLYEEEKMKNEKVAAIRKHQKNGSGEHAVYLPDIHSTVAAPSAAVALQQQAQLELTYQRKILSLMNQCKDLVENNKRLLRKIEQLEKTEKDAGAEIESLRHENVLLGTQNDNLSNTVASQSSLIIGLRTSQQKFHQNEDQFETLMKKFDRSQIDLEATKMREKLLRDDHERLKLIMRKEKEVLMAKIMALQQQLEQKDRAASDLEVLNDRIRRLETDKRIVVEEMLVLQVSAAKAEERMHDQEQMTNRLLQENEVLQGEKNEMLLRLSRLQEELDRKSSLEANISIIEKREREVEHLMAQTIKLQDGIDNLSEANTKLQMEISIMRQTEGSQDETVQALQLARQKAATHEALSLVNEEKERLEAKIHELQNEWGTERTDLTRRIHEMGSEHEKRQEQIEALRAEVLILNARPIEQVVIHEDGSSTAEGEERASGTTDIEQLRDDYAELRENFDNIEREYNKLITKKYKTEAFQSQVKLLRNENTELGSQLEELARQHEQDCVDLQARAMEIDELQSRVLHPSVIDMLRQTQESLEKTVSSLVEAESASESTFTCLQCMRLFVRPMTLTPCGHTYCASCMETMGDVFAPSSIVCKECPSSQQEEIESFFPNHALADLTARFIFRQQTLSSLTTMCMSLRNSVANRPQSS